MKPRHSTRKSHDTALPGGNIGGSVLCPLAQAQNACGTPHTALLYYQYTAGLCYMDFLTVTLENPKLCVTLPRRNAHLPMCKLRFRLGRKP